MKKMNKKWQLIHVGDTDIYRDSQNDKENDHNDLIIIF